MKVFGIGMPRTGTTSLTKALEILGFTPALHNPYDTMDIGTCGSATDLTVAWRFRSLSLIWPDSKFIYTKRDVNSWLVSIDRHYRQHYIDMDALQYDHPIYPKKWFQAEAVIQTFSELRPDREAFEIGRRRHEVGMRAFFRTRPGRLMEIDVTRDIPDREKWEPICRFLGVPAPDISFPYENQFIG